MKRVSCLLLIAAAAGRLAGEPVGSSDASLAQAEVTLPYPELRALLDAANAAKQKDGAPPLGSAVIAARYALDFQAGAGVADFDVAVLGSSWQVIPLAGSDLPATRTEPEAAVVVARDGSLCLVAREPGRMRVRIHFAVGLRDGGFRLSTRAATSTRLSVTGVPEGHGVQVEGAFADGSGGYLAAAGGGVVGFRLVERRAEVPTSWRMDAAVLAREENARLCAIARVHLHPDDAGSGLSGSILLSRDARVLRVEGDDLEGWSQQQAEQAARRVDLRWNASDGGSRTVVLHYTLPLPPEGEPWTVVPPSLPDRERSRALIAVVEPEGWRLTPPAGDRPTLPAWISEEAGSRSLAVARAPEGVPVVFAASELPRLDTPDATIRRAAFETRLVAEGGLLCDAVIRIAHRAAVAWELAIPEGCELLSFEVNGTRTRPVIRPDGRLEVNLPAAADTDGISEARFSYTSRMEKFAPVEGSLTLALPETPLFVHDLVWALQLPEGYEATALDGNVEIREGGGPSRPIVLGRRLANAEQARISVFYRKRTP